MTKEILDNNKKIVTVWFDAWRYEREENLAVIPFLRTVKLTLDASEKSKEGKWGGLINGIKRTTTAYLTATKVKYGPAETDLGEVAESLKGDGSIAGDKDTPYYHATEFLEKGLADLRKDDNSYRIVVFVDDLDRCSPDKALEVLESIKSFFDIEGIVYVIGMDAETINSLVKQKYGGSFAIKGLDYLQKIVQLPFQVPEWKEVDLSNSVRKIITQGLKDSEFVEQFEKNTELIVKAVELNPRQVKRFINNIILAKSVFSKPVDELIVVQALHFRPEWNSFLELITPDDTRMKFLKEYKRLKEKWGQVAIIDHNEFNKEISAALNAFPLFKEILDPEVFKRGNALTAFLDAGAAELLSSIEKMEEYRRAVVAFGGIAQNIRILERVEASIDLKGMGTMLDYARRISELEKYGFSHESNEMLAFKQKLEESLESYRDRIRDWLYNEGVKARPMIEEISRGLYPKLVELTHYLEPKILLELSGNNVNLCLLESLCTVVDSGKDSNYFVEMVRRCMHVKKE